MDQTSGYSSIPPSPRPALPHENGPVAQRLHHVEMDHLDRVAYLTDRCNSLERRVADLERALHGKSESDVVPMQVQLSPQILTGAYGITAASSYTGGPAHS